MFYIVNEIKFCVLLPRPSGGEAKSSTTIFVGCYNNRYLFLLTIRFKEGVIWILLN